MFGFLVPTPSSALLFTLYHTLNKTHMLGKISLYQVLHFLDTAFVSKNTGPLYDLECLLTIYLKCDEA